MRSGLKSRHVRARPVHARARFVRRTAPFLSLPLALALAFVIGALLIMATGVSPVAAYSALLRAVAGSRNGIAETLVKTVPLLLAGLGTSVAYRGRLVNIGAEGQIYMGAIGATAVGLFLGNLPRGIGLPLALVAGIVMGALWGGLAGLAKVRFKASELICSLMLNYVAIQIVSYLTGGPWKDPSSTNAFTAVIATGARLPIVLPGTRLHAGIFIAAAAVPLLWFVHRHTVYGYQLSVVGINDEVAAYAGIDVNRLSLLTMLASGGLAGLAGAIELTGLHGRLLAGLSPGYGYTAIAIAMLGRNKPFAVLAAALFFAMLSVGGDGMQQDCRVPAPIIVIIGGLFLLLVLGGEALKPRIQAVVAGGRD